MYHVATSNRNSDKVGAVVTIGKDYVSLLNADTKDAYTLNNSELFGVDFDTEDFKIVVMRLLYVLECKAKINLSYDIRYVDGTPLEGVDNPTAKLVMPDSIRSVIWKDSLSDKYNGLQGSNIFNK